MTRLEGSEEAEKRSAGARGHVTVELQVNYVNQQVR